MLPPQGVAVVRTVVSLLVEGRYEDLETLTDGRRLTAPMMERAIRAHGCDLIDPPDEAFAGLDVYEIENGAGRDHRPAYAVDMTLWTAQEGRSALEVRLTLVEAMDGVWTVQVDDILVP
jgi:hypothetical protein